MCSLFRLGRRPSTSVSAGTITTKQHRPYSSGLTIAPLTYPRPTYHYAANHQQRRRRWQKVTETLRSIQRTRHCAFKSSTRSSAGLSASSPAGGANEVVAHSASAPPIVADEDHAENAGDPASVPAWQRVAGEKGAKYCVLVCLSSWTTWFSPDQDTKTHVMLRLLHENLDQRFKCRGLNLNLYNYCYC